MNRLSLHPGLGLGPPPRDGSTWSVDGTGQGVPASSAEWSAAMSSAAISSGNPSYGWGFQEASGNLSSFLNAATLTAFGASTYQQAIAGWTRRAIAIASASAFYNTTIGNTATTSYMWLAYLSLAAAPGSTAAVLTAGAGTASADGRSVYVTTTPRYSAIGGGVVSVDGTSDPGTAVRPIVLLFNRAASEFSVLTDQEKITTAWVNPTSGTSSYVSVGDGIDTARCLYAVLFEGTAAELSRTQVKTLLTTLGWSIAWTP